MLFLPVLCRTGGYFIECEAENAAYIGTLSEPDYLFTPLPAEASGREVVQVKGQGQYVEFTLIYRARRTIPLSAELKFYTN